MSAWQAPSCIEKLAPHVAKFRRTRNFSFNTGLGSLVKWIQTSPENALLGEHWQSKAIARIFDYLSSKRELEMEMEDITIDGIDLFLDHNKPEALSIIGDVREFLNTPGSIEDFESELVPLNQSIWVPVTTKVPVWAHALYLLGFFRRETDFHDFHFKEEREFFYRAPRGNSPPGSGYRARWSAAVKIAYRWHQQLAQLEASTEKSASRAALLATNPTWTRLLDLRPIFSSPVWKLCFNSQCCFVVM